MGLHLILKIFDSIFRSIESLDDFLFNLLIKNFPEKFINLGEIKKIENNYDFMILFLILTLSSIIGYFVVSKVTSALHSPLMSLTNVISSVIIISGITIFSENISFLFNFIAFVIIMISSINIVGGFFVTERMIKNFKIKERK